MPSSVIRSWHYDEAACRLHILFVSGQRYRYDQVPPYIAAGLQSAASKGRYFNSHIRDCFVFTED